MKAVWITLLAIAARGLQFCFLVLVGIVFGATAETDQVFFLAAPLYALGAILHGVAEATVMPALLHAQRTGSLIGTTTLLSRSALLGAIAGSIVIVAILHNWLAPATSLLMLLFWIPAFSALSTVRSSELNARRRFVSAVLAPAYGAVGGILLLIFSEPGAISLATALVGFEASRWLVLRTLVGLTRSVSTARLQARDTAHALKLRIQQSIGWQALGASLVAINPVIDMLFASFLGDGAISFIEYGNRLWTAVPLLFSGPLLLAYFRWSSEDSRASFQLESAKRVALKATFVSLALTPIACLLVPTAIAAAFGLGVMSEEDKQTLASILFFYILGTGPLGGGLFLSRAYSAAGKLHILAAGALAGLVVNILGDWILSRYLSLSGIALATTLSYAASFCVMLFYPQERRLD
jgi:putative peptidoglycan lipid II flippase